MSDKDVEQQESKCKSWVRYKPTRIGKIALIISPLLIIISLIISILMLLSIIHGIVPFILVLTTYIIVIIIIMILALDIRKFNWINNRDKLKKSNKEEYFVAGLIVGIFIGVIWSGLFR